LLSVDVFARCLTATVQHLAPLFVTLGVADDPESPAERVIDGFWMGLSKRSVLLA
jgi:4,5-DOPA dioxygenase extradiol